MSEDKKDVAGEVAKNPVEAAADWAYPFTAEQMKGWKEKFQDVFCLKINDKFYVYKALSVGELRELQVSEMKTIRELETNNQLDDDQKMALVQSKSMERTVAACVLWPENFSSQLDAAPCGVIDRLNAEIFKVSGYEEAAAEPMKL